MEDYRYGSVIIEERSSEGLSAVQSVGLIMVGAAIMGLAFAVAVAIIQLSMALSVSIVAIGLGFGGSLAARGVAEIILAWGRARALVVREAARAEVERARAEMEKARTERARLEVERARLERAQRDALAHVFPCPAVDEPLDEKHTCT